MTRHQHARAARARLQVLNCHAQFYAWADNRAPELRDLRAFALRHYSQHKARALQELRAILNAH